MKPLSSLFKLFGYVPEENYNDYPHLQTLARHHHTLIDGIHTGKASYCFHRFNDGYEVYVVHNTPEHSYSYPVKYFPFTKETRDYARLCAEELCEFLNQN